MRLLYLIALLTPFICRSQLGGVNGYQALNVTSNARTAALAGTTVSIMDGDLSQFFENPAILDSVRAQSLFFNVNPYFADISAYTGAYTFTLPKVGVVAAGIHYIDYGDFEGTDASGNITNTFNSNDFVFTLGTSHQVGLFSLGVNLKLAHTSIESYNSTAILGDIAGVFSVNKYWTLAMVFSNIGGRLSEFTPFSSSPIPFDVKLGTTFKPEYMPLRFTITTSNLVDDNVVEEADNEGRSNSGFDSIIRRINFGAEILISKNFQFLVGYNHKRKQELRLEETGGGAGFSYGLMLRVKQFQLRFSRATYHAAGGTSFISVQTNLRDFKKIL